MEEKKKGTDKDKNPKNDQKSSEKNETDKAAVSQKEDIKLEEDNFDFLMGELN